MSLKVGKFSLVVLNKSIDDGEIIIENPLYNEQDTLFRDENIIHLIKDEVTQAIELKEAPFASWLLARLWFLTNGEIKEGLNIYEENIGCQDGGWYYCQFSLEDFKDKTVAIIYVEACSWYENVFIKECSESVTPLELIEFIKHILIKEPTSLAVCSIGIEDPEENGKLYTYGWDGTTFLGKQSQW
jgi:hypothetical protein